MNTRDQLLEAFASYSRKAAAEGVVLLKNDDQILPLNQGTNLAVFGRCQIDYYRSGTGSGGSVHVPYKVNAIDGLRGKSQIRINDELAKAYEVFVEENPFDNGGGGWAAEPWFQKEMPLDSKLMSSVRAVSDVALIIIGRTAGEEQDNHNKEGSYLLTRAEEDMIKSVTDYFDQVIVALNVSNIIDMSWSLKDYKHPINSILYAWHGGMEGGNALADVLTGLVHPSGRLTDTIAYNLTDYPSDKNFGNDDKNYYQEDIYVGYRYFETFKPEAVMYPFGFGLSFTGFDQEVIQVNQVEDRISFSVKVTNTGSQFAGREVVQIYYEVPQGAMKHPIRQLGAFGKTESLEPGQSQILEIDLPIRQMSAYDEDGRTGYPSAYVLCQGTYNIYIGSNVRHAKLVDKEIWDGFNVAETRLVEQLEPVMRSMAKFERMTLGKRLETGGYEVAYEPVPMAEIDMVERTSERMPVELKNDNDAVINLQDVKNGHRSLEEFIASLSDEDLEIIVRGEGMSSPKVTSGTAAAFGGISDHLQSLGVPVACAADGPSGIRMDSGEEAIQVPIGTLLACSWDTELVENLYKFEGQELIMNQVDTLLGPGMNIHRHPLNGRNFEYFSEDPLLTGKMAAAITRGIGVSGAQATLKHFACNDQEHLRSDVDSIVSERALREIHLRPFEIAVKEGGAKSIMTAYNPINGIWSASNYDLNTTVLRKEWGYEGIVMTDWWAKMNDPITGGEAKRNHVSSMVRAQNDVYMVVSNYGAEVNSAEDDTKEALSQATLSRALLQQSAMNICRFLLEAPCMGRPVKEVECMEIPAGKEPDGENEILEIDQPITLQTTTDTKKWLYVAEEGTYSISIRMRYDYFPSGQSAVNLILNALRVSNIQQNGTFGNWVKQKVMNVKLSEGWYELQLEFTNPGLEVDYILIK